MSDLSGLVDEARDVAVRAGDLTLEWFRRPDLPVERKHDGTVVTEADRAAEVVVRRHVAEAHPDDALVGEEHGSVDGPSGRRWFVDPIDGTAGFVRGVPLYSTLVAVCDDDGPLVGVIHLPAIGTTMWAGRGSGCHVDGRPCRVSTVGTLADGLITTSGYETFDAVQLGAIRHSGAALRTWGDGYGYYLVAAGHAEAMIDPVANTWDLAPMPVILAEAGGRFTSVDGEPSHDTGSGVATNGLVHDEVLDAMATR